MCAASAVNMRRGTPAGSRLSYCARSGPGGLGHCSYWLPCVCPQMEVVGGDNMFLLCATNCPWELDPAFLRRFQKKILISLPARSGHLLHVCVLVSHAVITFPQGGSQ